MLDFSGSTTVYLACGVTDLRKSYTGLAAIIKLKFHLDPYSRCMFAFCNRRRTLIKILQWDGSGFWILMKRLDRNSFHWPDTPDELRKVTLKEIHWLCDGLSLNPSGAFEVLMLSLAVMIPLCHADMKLPGYLSWNVPFDGADNRPITEGISSYIHALPAL